MQLAENRVLLLLLALIVAAVYFLSQQEIRETLYDYILLALEFTASETPHLQKAGL